MFVANEAYPCRARSKESGFILRHMRSDSGKPLHSRSVNQTYLGAKCLATEVVPV